MNKTTETETLMRVRSNTSCPLLTKNYIFSLDFFTTHLVDGLDGELLSHSLGRKKYLNPVAASSLVSGLAAK